MKFKQYLKQIKEETTSGDIAQVTTKLDMVKRPTKHLQKGKMCKKHKILNCEECLEERYDN